MSEEARLPSSNRSRSGCPFGARIMNSQFKVGPMMKIAASNADAIPSTPNADLTVWTNQEVVVGAGQQNEINLVEVLRLDDAGNVGIGDPTNRASNPVIAIPDPALYPISDPSPEGLQLATGNLDVHDLFLRSLGEWLSASAGAPPKFIFSKVQPDPAPVTRFGHPGCGTTTDLTVLACGNHRTGWRRIFLSDASGVGIAPKAATVILEAELRMLSPDTGSLSGGDVTIWIRRGGSSLNPTCGVLPRWMFMDGFSRGGGDDIAWSEQAMYPVCIRPNGVRYIDYRVQALAQGGARVYDWEIRLVGYFQ